MCAATFELAENAILHGLAFWSQRTTLYILTDTRVIMRIGMAIEARINVPLKHVLSADLRKRGETHGDISLNLGGERTLGYALLWPHARRWRFSQPEPMLRAIPEAEKVAKLLADAAAKHVAIERAADAPEAAPPRAAPIAQRGLEGAPA